MFYSSPVADIDPDTGEVDNDVKFAHYAKKRAIVARLRAKVRCSKCRTTFTGGKTLYIVSKDGARRTPSWELIYGQGSAAARILRNGTVCCAACSP